MKPNKTQKKEPSDRLLMITMIGVIISIWSVFLLQVFFQAKAAREDLRVPMLEMTQVMSDVDDIFSKSQAELIHYVYDNTGAVVVEVDPYNQNVWYVRFMVGNNYYDDVGAAYGYSDGCAGIAYGYTKENGWEAWDWGWPDVDEYVTP